MINKYTHNKTSPDSNAGGTALTDVPAKADWTPPTLLGDVLAPAPLKMDLSEDEHHQLLASEAIIAKANALSWQAVQALAVIRDERLYRDNYETFEKYCQERWGFGRSFINRQIGAAQVVKVLGPIGSKIDSESVARPLVGLKDEQIVAAFQEAQKLAGDNPVTAKVVRQAAAEFKPLKPRCIPVKQPSAVEPINLAAALKILAQVENTALNCKSKRLLKELAALRKCLLALAGANALLNSETEMSMTATPSAGQ